MRSALALHQLFDVAMRSEAQELNEMATSCVVSVFVLVFSLRLRAGFDRICGFNPVLKENDI